MNVICNLVEDYSVDRPPGDMGTIEVECMSAELSNVFNGVSIDTDQGRFGIAQRDAGIEVMLNGEHVWSSSHANQWRYVGDADGDQVLAITPSGVVHRLCLVSGKWEQLGALDAGVDQEDRHPSDPKSGQAA